MTPAHQRHDLHAAAYDRLLADSDIRSEVWEIADRFFLPGMRLLDLGCGTGDDAIHFARRGLHVTAVDVSSAMIGVLKLKSGGMVQCEQADMQNYCPAGAQFDGVFSNFSALNYVSELSWLKRLRLRRGSHLVFTTLGRFYPLDGS